MKNYRNINCPENLNDWLLTVCKGYEPSQIDDYIEEVKTACDGVTLFELNADRTKTGKAELYPVYVYYQIYIKGRRMKPLLHYDELPQANDDIEIEKIISF